jgi:3D-(3,5/4)-trihydroxycyclohexane-1,2-dione acylhydrolase (decyclizing)
VPGNAFEELNASEAAQVAGQGAGAAVLRRGGSNGSRADTPPGGRSCRTTTRLRGSLIAAPLCQRRGGEADVVSPSAHVSRISRPRRGRRSIDVRLVSINVARYDAVKHAGHSLVGDALVTVTRSIGRSETGRPTRHGRHDRGAERRSWDAHIDTLRSRPGAGGD